MKAEPGSTFSQMGGSSFLSGIAILTSLAALLQFPSLRGPHVIFFLAYFLIAALAYGIAVMRLGRDFLPLKLVWIFALAFRVIILFTEPTLSDDVNRYAWDGHLLNQGVNPYLLPVESPQLDAYNIPLRSNVNHAWMASPYLPTTQLLFALVSFIAPQSIKAFQIAAVVFDLLTGWLLLDLLRRFDLPARNVLIYLWNPLVIVEFAHGAHSDSLMIFLMMLSIWFHVRAERRQNWMRTVSAITLALATLTKIIPVLLAPLFVKRWGWRNFLLFIGLILLVLSLFSIGAGWGLTGDLDGTGVFGAFRIYSKWWNFNSGIYHWLEVLISGFPTPGAIPVEIVGEQPRLIARMISVVLLGFAAIFAHWQAQSRSSEITDLPKFAILPLGAYLLLSPTIHPWYVTIIMPFLVFLPAAQRWPWIYLSLTVAFSYLTYLNPDDLREYTFVRWVEYIPVYVLLIWGLAKYLWGRKKIAINTVTHRSSTFSKS